MKRTIKTEASVGNNYTVNPLQADVFVLPLSEPLTTIAINNADPGTEVDLILKQTVGGRKVQWASNIQFAFFRTPKLSYDAGYADKINLLTLDGVKWIATYDAGWFNA